MVRRIFLDQLYPESLKIWRYDRPNGVNLYPFLCNLRPCPKLEWYGSICNSQRLRDYPEIKILQFLYFLNIQSPYLVLQSRRGIWLSNHLCNRPFLDLKLFRLWQNFHFFFNIIKFLYLILSVFFQFCSSQFHSRNSRLSRISVHTSELFF